MSRPVTLGLVQMSMVEDAYVNLAKATKLIGKASDKGANIVCLPELFTTLYFPQDEKALKVHPEKIPGETTVHLSKAARDASVVLVGGSIHEKAGKKLYNTSVIFDENGKILGKYRKMHIPYDENFYEQNYFLKGDLGFKIFKTSYGKIAPLICYDQWFPEAARIAALAGSEIIFYPTAIGWVKGVEPSEGNWQEAWEAVQRGHAIANNVIVAGVNRAGIERSMTFWGGSFAYNAFGKLLARGSMKEEIVMAECDLDHNTQVREGWRFFYNRRPETYKKITAME